MCPHKMDLTVGKNYQKHIFIIFQSKVVLIGQYCTGELNNVIYQLIMLHTNNVID